MKKILTTLAITTALGIGAFSLKAHAQESKGARPFIAEQLAQLNMSSAQIDQIHGILRQHMPTAQPLIKQLIEERRKLRSTIRGDEVDEKAIRAQVAKVASLEADLAVERARVVHELKPVLTPEQLEKLKNMQGDMDERIDGFLSRVAKRIAEE